MPERFGRRIPEPTVVRLPIYQRVLLDLSSRGVSTVSSAELADAAGVNAAKVRKDLSHFGTYGTPGTGYDVDFLLGQIQRELGTDQDRPVVIVGLGHLGHALARSQGFATGGFRLVGLFDSAPAIVGETIGTRPVQDVSELTGVCLAEGASVGIITTPAAAAQDVADALVAGGVGAILNFAPAVLTVPAHVQVRHVDFSAELQVLAFYQAHPETAATRDSTAAALRAGAGAGALSGASTANGAIGANGANGANGLNGANGGAGELASPPGHVMRVPEACLVATLQLVRREATELSR